MRGTKYTDDQLREIANWSADKTIRETCAHFGCHPRTVLDARVKFIPVGDDDDDIKLKRCGRKKMYIPPEEINTMQKMRNEGKSVSEVARVSGYSRSTVSSRTEDLECKYVPTERPEYKSKLKGKSSEMQAMRDNGTSLNDISEHFGCSVSSVVKSTKPPKKTTITIYTLESRYRKRKPLTEEKVITYNGKVVGTFTPIKSTH